MKVLLLSRYGQLGSSSRLRFYQFLPYLRNRGVEVTVSCLLGDEYITALYQGRSLDLARIAGAYFRRALGLLTSRRFSLLWIEKELFPWIPAWTEMLLGGARTRWVVDYDDALFHRYGLHANPLVRHVLSRKIDIVMRRAACVTVGSDYLAEYARKAGAARVELIPTCADLDRYRVKTESNGRDFVIGWIGSPATAPHLRTVQSALSGLCREGSSRITLVGCGDVELSGVPSTIRPWSEETEVLEIHKFDVGIMPLSDEPFARGKCGYKLIQYMACGLPVVASPVGAGRQIVEHGVNGYLAETVTDWVTALSRLRNDPVLRRRMGAAGRKKVERKYSVQVNAPKLASILKESNGVA